MTVLRRYLIIDVLTERIRLTSRDPSWTGKLRKSEYFVPIVINLPKAPGQKLANLDVYVPDVEVPPSVLAQMGRFGTHEDEDEHEYGDPVG